MAAARPSGDREAMEEALSGDQLRALEEALEDLELPADGWHESPSVAGFVELVAFAREVRRIVEKEGMTLEAARYEAGARLGLNDESVDRRLRRQRAAAAAAGVDDLSLVARGESA